MDKEVQEKIALLIYDELGVYPDSGKGIRMALATLNIIEELGYRKLPKDKPPLLSDNPYIYESEECRQHTAFDKGIRAQREADIKFYQGK